MSLLENFSKQQLQNTEDNYFKQFNSLENYFLLYLDQTVVDTLPGSAKPFILNWYKEELGKPFSKLYF